VNKLILGLAMIVSLAVPGAVAISMVVSSGESSSSLSPTSSSTLPSDLSLNAQSEEELVDDVNALTRVHIRIVKSINTSGSANPTDTARVVAIKKKLVEWKDAHGGLDPVSDKVASTSARFASSFLYLLSNPSSKNAYQKYRAALRAQDKAIAATR